MPGSTAIQKYNEAFLLELERLNPAQKEAVNNIEGPVLVIAGPGTGKTHILAARIGRILLETDTHPHNILCLTFTDAGVQAMRRRLLKLIGPDAHRVHIFTFHSFCNHIIQNNLERFGRRNLEPLSDLERVEVIRRILEKLPHRHILKQGRTDSFFYESHLQNLFRQMKAEHWTPELIRERTAAYLADLPNREEFVYKRRQGPHQKGDLKTAHFEREQLRMDRLNAAASLFPRYQALLSEMHRYDYEDMILWVLEAFREQPELLRYYQEQYLYFLVDEYQDTNGSQNEILQRLIEFWDNPNIFVVGDDDQSIYEFQGARLKNITEFYQTYQEHIKWVVLQENYRSSQPILDAAHALINQNQIRIVSTLQQLGVEKRLTASHKEFARVKSVPKIVRYPDRLSEETDICLQLEALIRNDFPLDEVAIIFAKHKQSKRLIELLEKKGISFRTRRPVNILDLPLVQNVRLLMEYLHSEYSKPYSGEHILNRIMHFGFLGIQGKDLARFAYQFAVQSGERSAGFWRDRIGDDRFLKRSGIGDHGAFLSLSSFLEGMISDYTNYSVPAYIERIINRSGLLRWMVEHPESEGSIKVIFTFLDFVKKEAARFPQLNLGRLLELLRSMDENRLQLPVIATNSSRRDGAGSGAVNLLTAHSSKGLEFRKVFLIDCVKDHWEPNNRKAAFQFSFPDTLTLSGTTDEMEARRRLFYVGMTRAKESLQLSFAAQNDDGKELQQTIFIDEVLNSELLTEISITDRSVSEKELNKAKTILLLEGKPAVEPLNRGLIDQLLENFTLSISSMNKYLRCPLGFYYENILNVPVLSSESAYFGIAMHNTLCRGFEKMLANANKEFPDESWFVRIFEEEMKSQAAFLSRKDYDRRLELGRSYIQEYVHKNRSSWPTSVAVEKEFRNVVFQGVPLTGVIDRIDYMEKERVHLVDYKTGSHDRRKLQRPTAKNPEGGNYWRQLIFYKILFENWRNNPYEVISAEISYLEPDVRGRFSSATLKFDPEEVAVVKKLIVKVYHKIKSQEFYEGCGEHNCKWCNFLKEQHSVDSFSMAEIEELDDL